MKELLGLGAALLGLLTWETLPTPDRPLAMPRFQAPMANAAKPEAPPVAAWVDVVEARPLFAQDRRPQPQAAGTAKAPGPNDTLPRLAGTVRSDDSLLAIFAPASIPTAKQGDAPATEPKPIVVGPDGIVAGWTVVAIDDGAVTLERNGRTSTLTLTYANTPVAPSAAEPVTMVVLHEKRSNPFLQP
jgi:hypothetical protein